MGASVTDKRHVNQRQRGKHKPSTTREWNTYLLETQSIVEVTKRKNHVLLKCCRVVAGKTKTMQLEKTANKKQWNGLFNNTPPTSCANSTKTNKTKATSNGENSKPATPREWKCKQNHKNGTTGLQIGNEIGQNKRSNEKFRCSKLEVETAPLPQANDLQKVGVLGCKTWKFATTCVDFAHLGVACFQLLHHVFVVLFVDDELFVNDDKRK